MAIDGGFCEAHLALIFTRLRDESDKGTRAALMVALGDLAFRFPNAVEPWTEHLYGVREWGNSLHDPDSGVRQHAITVLAHLVLNDMMKVKGHIAEMARCLEDPDPRRRGREAALRRALAQAREPHLQPAPRLAVTPLRRRGDEPRGVPRHHDAPARIHRQGQADRGAGGQACTASRRRRWRPRPSPRATSRSASPALALSDRAFKKFMDAWKLYEPALYDREVFAHLDAVVAKAKKTYGGKKAFAKSACETDAAGDEPPPGGAAEGDRGLRRRRMGARTSSRSSHRTARRAEGHAVDEDETPAVTLGGGRPLREGRPRVPRSLRTPTARRTPRRAAAARRRRRRRRRRGRRDAPSAPKALAEEEARAEAEA